MRFVRPSGEVVILAGFAAYVLVLGIWPLGRLLLEAFGMGETGNVFGLLRESFESRAVRRAAWNTLTASGLSVIVSAVVGTLLAFAVCLAGVRLRTAATFLILSPLLVPSQISALAWIELLGSNSPILGPLGLAPAAGTPNPLYSGGGIAFLMGIEHMPLVFLAVRAALGVLPRDLVEAARLAGARTPRILLRIVLPTVVPAVLAGAILAFAAAIGNFGVPALLGIPGRYTMLTTLIYQRLNGFGPSVIGQVATLALLLVAMAAGALLLRWFVLRRLAVPIERGGAPFAGFELGRWRAGVEAALWLTIGAIAILPLVALLAASLTPALGVPLSLETATLANFTATLLENPAVRRAFANSTALSLGAALVCGGLAVPFAYLAGLRGNGIARALDSLADAPFVVPGTVLALAMILVFLPPLPGIGISIYGTALILFVAYLARFLPLALRPVGSAVAGLEPALDEAARIVGARVGRRLWRVHLPLLAPAAFAGGVLVFLTAFSELTVSALLWSSGVETVGVMIFSLQYEGRSPSAAAVSVASVAMTLGLALLVDRFAHRLPPGALPWRG